VVKLSDTRDWCEC